MLPQLDKQIVHKTNKIVQLTHKQTVLREGLHAHNLDIMEKDETIAYLDNRVAELEEQLENRDQNVTAQHTSVLVSSEVPTWMQIMHKSKRIRGVSK